MFIWVLFNSPMIERLVCGCRTPSEFAKGCTYSIYSNMCAYLISIANMCSYLYMYIYIFIYGLYMYWLIIDIYIYTYHIFFVLVQDAWCCLQLFTPADRDDVYTNGPSPRLHHNGMPHRWGARPAGQQRKGWQVDKGPTGTQEDV